jgi:hypothetical protein
MILPIRWLKNLVAISHFLVTMGEMNMLYSDSSKEVHSVVVQMLYASCNCTHGLGMFEIHVLA